MAKLSLLLIIVLLSLVTSNGQSVDSRVNQLLDLYANQKYSEVVIRVDSLLPLVENKSRLYQIKADALYFLNDVDASLKNYLLTLKHLKKGSLDTTRLIEAFSHTGFCYIYTGEYVEAIPYYEEALKISVAANDSIETSNQLSNLGNIYSNLNQFEKAENYLIKAYQIDFALNDSIALSYNLADLGALKFRLEEYRSSIDLYRQSLKVTKTKANNHNTMLLRMNKLAEAYAEFGMLDSARYYNDFAYEESVKLQDSLSMAKIWLVKGKILGKDFNYIEAIDRVKIAIQYFEREGAERYAVKAKFMLSGLYLNNKQSQKSIAIIKSIIPYLRSRHDIEGVVKAYEQLALAHEDLGEYVLALENFKKYQIFLDSLTKKDKQLSILTLEKRFESGQKEQQIFSLETLNKLQAAEAKAQKRDNIILLVTALLLLIILLFIYYRYKVKIKNEKLLQDKNSALNQLNQAKNKLFAIISHDLRNPVSAFRNMTEALDENFHKLPDKKTAEYLKKMRYNAAQVETQLNDLLAWASNEIGKEKLSTRSVDIKPLIEQVFNLLKPLAEAGRVELDFLAEDDIVLNTHPELFKTVIRNIISNAIKFTPQGGQVFLSAKIENGQPVLCITDTGVGMEKEQINILFSDNKMISQEKSEMGMGLSITKDIMERLKGEIEVNSVKGKGTSFTLKFAA